MRKKLTAVILAVLVFSLIAASAASLGGITYDGVGADNVSVNASCETDLSGVHASFETAWDSGDSRYEVSRVVISGIHDDCLGQRISVTLTQGLVEVSRGPSGINAGPSDDNFRGWNLGDSDIIAGAPDFDIHVSIAA